MKASIARILALAFAGAAAYLVVPDVHAARAVLEAALGAAVLCIGTAVLLWRAPAFAAILNACWIAASFAAGIALGGAHPSAEPAQAELSPQDAAAKMDSAAKALKPEDYALPALAAQVPTIESAFAWVRDNVRYEAYDGILRGSKGTLYARAGNAADRAMLLAALLQINKIPVRIATGELPPAQAERLYARIFEPDPSGANPDPSMRGPVMARIFDRGRRDYHLMLAALGNGVPAVTAPSHDDVVKEIQSHAWVQAQRDGQWIDLDPSFRDATVGQSYAAAQQTYDKPPVPLMQQVTIRVTTERLVNGVLVKDVALEQTVPAYQIIDKQVYLAHRVYRPFNGQGGNVQFIFGNKDVAEPLLYFNGARAVGKPIDFGSGASAAGTAPPNSVQAAVNAFGTTAPGSSTAANAFVAERLEFEIDFPDGRKDVTERPLIDRADAAWRSAANPDPSKLHDLARIGGELAYPQTIYNIWFSAGKHNLPSFAAAEKYLSNGTYPSRNPASPTFEEQVWPLAIRDLSWFVASDHVIVPAINDTAGLRLYADSPRIFMWSVGPDQSGRADKIVVESDLRRDALRGVAKDESAQSALAQHKLLFGALEGALEHELSVPSSSEGSPEFVTTSSLAESGSVVAIGPGSPAAAADPQTQSRLAAALAGGDTLIVPKAVLAGGAAGWWQIASATGDVHAVLGDVDGSMNAFMRPAAGGFPGPPKPITGFNGVRQSYYADLEQEFEPVEELYAKCIASTEIGEDCASSGRVITISVSTMAWVGAGAAAAATIAYEIFK
ncbi:MAG: hypothetical protein JO160_04815 [Candidatus Eremiobacteraeota bacterium]|nr:hypothetical protein [Candidatus Eremiobacteraeota bacterium]